MQATVLQEARLWDRGARQTSTLQALSLSQSHLQRSETKVPQDGPIPAVESTGCPYPQRQEISLGLCWPGASHQSSVFTHSRELNLT